MLALEEVARNLEQKPTQVVVDGGFTNLNNIIQCAAQQVDLVGSLPDPKDRIALPHKFSRVLRERWPRASHIIVQPGRAGGSADD